jgi:hypothetical protein
MRTSLTGSNRKWLCFVAAIALLLGMGASTRLAAQVVGATLSGTVTDASGGAVPNAAVSIKNNATGDTRDVTTNSDGLYTAPNLQPGVYTVTTTAAGFSKLVQSGVTLTVGGAQSLNLTMQVGQATQTVEVTAEAPTVNLSNAEIGGITNEKTIEELPLNGRSWSDLANLQAGVYQLHTQPGIETRDRFTRGYGVQLSISGGRPQQNNYRVDGISINDPGNGGPGNVFGANAGVDAIAEFSVLTTNYSTEYGRASGGIINATTKSGTNTFHGSAYEFLRSSWLDSKNFYDDPTSKIPNFRRNQFGASAGGPIIKGKTFVFGDYEGLRQAKGLSASSIIPSVAAAATANAAVKKYLDAFFPIGGSLGGKTICTIVVSGTNTDHCVFGANEKASENYYIIRADHNISDKDRLSGTFFRDKSTIGRPDEYNNKITNTATSSTFATVAETHSFSANVINSARFGYSRVFQGGPAGATAINPNTADTAFGAIPGYDAPAVFINNNTSIFTGGLTSFNPQTNHWNSFQFYDDAFWTKGKHALKFGFNVERDQNNIFRSPRPGGSFQYGTMDAFLNNQASKLVTDLPGAIRPVEPRATIFGGYIQDDFRLRPNLTINLGLRYEPMQIAHDPQGRNATILSIYDTTGSQLPSCGKAQYDSKGTLICNSQIDGLFRNNTRKNFEPRVGFAWDPKGNGKMSIRGGFGFYDQLPLLAFMGSTSNNNTAPFLQSGGGNLVASSFGKLGDFGACVLPAQVGDSAFCQAAGGASSRVAFIEQTPKRAYVMQYNLNIQREIAPNLTALIGYVGSRGVHGPTQSDDPNTVFPVKNLNGTYLWPCDNIQPNVGGGINNILPAGGNINQCPAVNPVKITNPSYPTLNATFGRMPSTFFRNSSVYHGLQAQLTKQMSHGLQATVSFTYQKSIDTASGAVISDSVITAISTLDWFDPNLTRAVSDFNTSKVFSANYLWNVPTPKSWSGFAGSALGGWQLSGIFSASTGEPMTPIMTGANGGDPRGLNNSDPFAYPDRLASCGNSLTNPGKNNNYIKLQCFQIPAVVTVGGINYIPRGNSGRNILTGPGLMNFDFSLVKNTKVTRISETFNVQLKWEVFNLFNRANFNPPVTNETIFDASALPAGQVAVPGPTGPCPGGPSASGCNGNAGALDGGDGTASDSRQMQLSLKISW